MKIEYISHACLLVDTGREKILLDPWFTGPAYNNQWHLFPKPVNTDRLKSGIDYILITHGHEDHLHERSLKELPKTAHIYYPFTWYGDATPYFHELGFAKSNEATSWKRMKFSSDTYVTFISHNLDTIVVIESNGKVLVDINDALPANNAETINYFTSLIKERWPKIDYVFSVFGGASYFPNNIHAPFKNDIEIAKLRVDMILENFFLIVNNLQPKIAVPFAADFVLLDPENLWINKTKETKDDIIKRYNSYFPEKKGQIEMMAMYSGDILEDATLIKNSAFHNIPDSDYEKLILKEYGDVIEAKVHPAFISEEKAEKLTGKIREQVTKRKTKFWYHAKKMQNLQFDVKIPDVKDSSFYHVSIIGDKVEVKRNKEKQAESVLQVDIRSDDLLYSFGSDWGGDVINIGYCAQIYLTEEKYVIDGTEGLCLRLLTNHPNEDDYITKPSYRAMKFIVSNPVHKDWFTKKLLRIKSPNLREKLYNNDKMYDHSVWLTKSKCEICEICKMPNRDNAVKEALN